MHSSSWRDFLKKIPSAYYDALTLTTSAGVQIIVNSIVKDDNAFLAVQGRTSGSEESGRLFIVPYEQICFLSFMRPIPPSQMSAIFGVPERDFERGNNEISDSLESPEQGSDFDEAPTLPAGDDSADAAETNQPAESLKKSKALLLKKLRERLESDKTKQRP